MNNILIFSAIVAAVITIDNFISGLFLTIRECNKNKYEYLKSTGVAEDPFEINL